MTTDILMGMRVFAAVVDAGSFAGAAEKLELSRGMTSRYVAQVERHLGVRLLNRTTRRLSLTEAGQDYYQRANQVLGLVEDAERSAAQGVAEPRGNLRINTSVAFGARHLGPVVTAYLQRFPHVKAELTLNDRMVDLVDEGFDVAVRIARKVDPGLVARPIGQARVMACASPGYLKKHGTPRTPEELARHNCMSYAHTGQQHQWRFSRGGRGRKVVVTGNFNANNGDILCSAAASGLGVILQPTFLAHELLRDGLLVRILDGWEPEGYTIYAVYPSRQFLTPKVRTFIDFLIDRFGDNPYWDKQLA